MMLEAALYSDNCFATLTYREEALPDDLSVSPKTTSDFIKRLRKRGYKFRYFACGEYGEDTQRPHYHLALFGFPTCAYGITRKREYCCAHCRAVEEAWGKGQIMLGTLEPKSMAYVAGYITKKMTRLNDPRLKGRKPEFARMSLRPGIGLGMMHEVASTLMDHGLDETLDDVPSVLQHGKLRYPLGRYLRRNLRTMIGRAPNAPPETLKKARDEMQPLRQAAFNSSTPLKVAVLETTLGRRIQIEARAKMFKKGKRI